MTILEQQRYVCLSYAKFEKYDFTQGSFGIIMLKLFPKGTSVYDI
jgi:hypothetical protein